MGLFSFVMTNMGLVRYALGKGYVPVIDMQFNRNTYLEDNQVGKENAWEFYFKQPCGVSLKDIQNCKNVILSDGLITERNVFPTSEVVRDEEQYLLWRPFFQEYLHVNDEIYQQAQALKMQMFGGKRVLGVLCRGTDYVLQRPQNHPIQPDVDELIAKAIAVMQEQSCEFVYLATEDEGAYRKFREAFGDYLKVTQARRCEDIGSTNINDVSYDRENDRYLKGRDYLINIVLLSECNCLVAGSAGGTYAALLMGSEYEYQYIYDLGNY